MYAKGGWIMKRLLQALLCAALVLIMALAFGSTHVVFYTALAALFGACLE
jgi:hypothetical protein